MRTSVTAVSGLLSRVSFLSCMHPPRINAWYRLLLAECWLDLPAEYHFRST